jgi:hypothetical protein
MLQISMRKALPLNERGVTAAPLSDLYVKGGTRWPTTKRLRKLLSEAWRRSAAAAFPTAVGVIAARTPMKAQTGFIAHPLFRSIERTSVR